jgi:acyl-CoA synthetase (AMP-forming)/AMP-acid ligase II
MGRASGRFWPLFVGRLELDPRGDVAGEVRFKVFADSSASGMIICLGGIRESRSSDAADDHVGVWAEASCVRHNLAGRFVRVAGRFAADLAFVTATRRLSYRAILTAAWNFAAQLDGDPDFQRGDRVVLLMPNSPEYVVAFYGTLLAGGVVVPISEKTLPDRLQWLRGHCQAGLVITTAQVLQRRCDLAGETHLSLDVGHPPMGRDATPALAGDGTQLATLLYTSGTTGTPKGVMLTHRNLLANAESILGYLPIRQQDRALALIPFCHAYGNSVLQTHVLAGATLVVAGSPAFPNSVLEAIQQQQITSFSAVPELYQVLLDRSDFGRMALPSLRYLTVAGGAMKPGAVERLAQGAAPARLYVMYGQTEATARLAYLPPAEIDRRPNSIGRAIPGVELAVRDDAGRDLPPGSVGEICARGANVMRGYWADAAGTADVLNDDWLRTGDLARRDAEGFLYVIGRKRELIKLQGLNVSVREMSQRLQTAVPGSTAYVVPFVADNRTRLALFLVPGRECRPSERELRNLCGRLFARHEMPHYIELLTDVPLTDSWKTDLRLLTARAEQRWAGVPHVEPCAA